MRGRSNVKDLKGRDVLSDSMRTYCTSKTNHSILFNAKLDFYINLFLTIISCFKHFVVLHRGLLI